MFIKRKTNPGKTYAYAMLLSFKTPLTYTFFFNFRPDNCVLCKAAFVGHNLNFTGHCPILMLKFRPERQQFFTTSNLVSVVFFSFYSRLSSLHEIAPCISKRFRNDTTYTSTALYFDFYIKYWTTSGFLLFWKSVVYLEPRRTSTMELFCENVNGIFSFTCGESRY